MHNKIPDLFSSKLCAHLKECEDHTRCAVKLDLRKFDPFYARERRVRERCIRDRKCCRNQRVKERMQPNPQRDPTYVDPPALPLKTIMSIQIVLKRTESHGAGRKAVNSRYCDILMPRISEIPLYKTRVSVFLNYRVGKKLQVETYMLFLGDHDNKYEGAFEVYELMAGEAGKEV